MMPAIAAPASDLAKFIRIAGGAIDRSGRPDCCLAGASRRRYKRRTLHSCRCKDEDYGD